MSATSLPLPPGAPPPDDPPRVVVDAGGEPWARLLSLLERRRSELPAGSVLQIHSANPLIRGPLWAWCRSTGCALTAETESRAAETGDQSTYRITLSPAPAARAGWLPPSFEHVENPEQS
ncbi:hypothetical protein G6045_00275 [Streptomyces sp. YC504]|uniref:DUF2249 domain-containing protein n=1 Tax=Streptomyces mesophilus TaxID=1775132 RepID=A0A6G4XB99_9ACTN|nr:hypothetical protein [Streptomyces mesophilus]NGO74130.1 hypothetical protein [Streptomyces mesophilus]